jgi:uncharacterized membrane protein YfcA
MSGVDALLILVGGFAAGVINAMAGGGSLLTVPLLSLVGIGGTVANGTNRMAVLAQNVTSAWGYSRRGVGDRRQTLPVLIPAGLGGLIGSLGATRIDDQLFERIFGTLMLPLLALSLWPPRAAPSAAPAAGSEPGRPWPRWLVTATFFGLGLYGGAVQAGIGLVLLLVLSRAGFDLVTANGIKTQVILVITAIAVPVFVLNGQVRWLAALVLSAGTGLGGYAGANLAVEGGERVIRPVLVVVVLVLASRMLGLWELID